MKILFMIIHILACVGIIFAILMQSSKSAGLSGVIAGGAEKFFGKKKGMDPLLAKITIVCAVIFLVTSIVLAFFLN